MPPQPELIVRVDTGKVRVQYGFGTGCGKHDVLQIHHVFGPNVRVNTGKVRVQYGLHYVFALHPNFFQQSAQKVQKITTLVVSMTTHYL